MRKTMFVAVLILVCLLSLSCDSTDPPKEVFKIVYQSPNMIYFKVPSIQTGIDPTIFQQAGASKIIKKYSKHFQPSADVMLDMTTSNTLYTSKQCFEIYKWLYASGIREIRIFTTDPKTGQNLLTDVVNEENSKLIRKIENSISYDSANVYERWKIDDFTLNESLQLIELSKKEPFDKIAPVIFHELFYKKQPEDENKHKTCLNNPSLDDPMLTPSQRKSLMAGRVLSKFICYSPKPSTFYTLLEMLQKSKSDEEKQFIIVRFGYNFWLPEAEEVINSIATNKSEDLEVRRIAFHTLLKRCDVNKYLPPAFDTIAEYKKPETKLNQFNRTILTKNDNYKMNEEIEKLYLSTGFKLLLELPEDKLQSGYHVARNLGWQLKIESQFSPNRGDKKYDGNDGFNLFATETVQNALNWYRENWKD